VVTGGAGFLGSHLCEALLARGDEVVGIDNFDPFYAAGLKQRNVAELRAHPNAARFRLVEGSIEDRAMLELLGGELRPEVIIHLAAIPFARPPAPGSPRFIEVNVRGTVELLELARSAGSRFVLASTAAVYGHSQRRPSREEDPADRSLTAHAGSKRAAELLAQSFHHLYGLDVTVLRLFTVYGPRNRPDLFAARALESLTRGTPLVLFDGGRVLRDFVFVDDAVAGIVAAAERAQGFEVFNLGRGVPVTVSDFVSGLERASGQRARRFTQPRPDNEPAATHADLFKANAQLDYHPRVGLDEGLERLWQGYCLSELVSGAKAG
jgi:UDP-glucuronate 4-epimerase